MRWASRAALGAQPQRAACSLADLGRDTASPAPVFLTGAEVTVWMFISLTRV